ncbi:MAG: hypothetical protein UV61_C0003G0049 [Candidatus Gottesmanbacteria bacterium GW2011_GWB1_43_11]|uniref:Glycosyltransferase RgtA/B/C/D-like domain-containing protein n=1 Tax=Candidatus Gottesmanbacteria bacterium GW2011_GWB1_43_11 TaxID=1618446 RepID=A0A0G1EW01_9BACT|nr:MAG: hypothetical protein UV04_C0002G0050 [Candidatus Gottesmanbacteria bacterium GW2011_GWA2_42_16]KKS56152.1 MAG: hypothetical protein UV17_C0002G0049 [Candidatus Gottesmanbacteria bacterium GW2011_GWA1_42_26]KKS82473.1 MAG: hypothetical protein UV55_C0002G0051 [Candidatus Gottesmanbacteria bacterium GW2011_GWC1_43_10]KKS87196.1 MAG: hypothetical protein UV61_C0003G0049 [Candidatus Gottesmanbacteria bacterium GW2011_GWB1_43_11]OGG26316.1 MAG: hypothetical protein A3A59_03715 [Candidatus Go
MAIKHRLLVFIIALAIFFRFYNFYDFQYWSGDEEVLTATIRHIIWDRSPTLLVQNASLGFGLGPFYHYFLTPFYYLTKFDLVNLQTIASVLGVITTFLVYKAGSEIGDKKLGLVASFLYATSFFISLFDRRLVHLTLNPVLSALTLWSLMKVIKKDYRFLPLLAFPIGFAFHEDASLIALVVAILITLAFFKVSLKNKYTAAGLVILGIFIMPFLMAEVRYHGVVSKAIVRSLARPIRPDMLPTDGKLYPPAEVIGVLTRVLFTAPSKFIEQNFCYCDVPLALFTPVTQLMVVIMLGISLYWLFSKKPPVWKMRLLWIMVFAFVISLYFYNIVFRGNFFQHYFMVFYPIFIVLVAQVLVWIEQRAKWLMAAWLIFYFSVNLYTLVNSQVKYPLYQKINLIKNTTDAIGNEKFSLYASNDPYIHGGGWTELYTLYFRPAVKSYHYRNWDWIYRAYSLFPTPIEDTDPKRVVVIKNRSDNWPGVNIELSKSTYLDLEALVLDNSQQTFRSPDSQSQ